MTDLTPTPAEILTALERLPEEDRRQLFAEAKARGLLPRRSRGEYFAGRNSRIVALRQRGLTPGQIAKREGMTRNAVRHVLRRRRAGSANEMDALQTALARRE